MWKILEKEIRKALKLVETAPRQITANWDESHTMTELDKNILYLLQFI